MSTASRDKAVMPYFTKLRWIVISDPIVFTGEDVPRTAVRDGSLHTRTGVVNIRVCRGYELRGRRGVWQERGLHSRHTTQAISSDTREPVKDCSPSRIL